MVTDVQSCVVGYFLAHTSKERSGSESRPIRERILHMYWSGSIPPFDLKPILWHVAHSQCLSNFNRLTPSMIKRWLFVLTRCSCLLQNSLKPRVRHQFDKSLRTWCLVLPEVRFGSHYISLILRAWIFITRDKICCHHWQANTAPSWLWLWRGSQNISRDMSTSSLQLCPPFCFSDDDRGSNLSSITSAQHEMFPHSRSDHHVCSI